MRPCSTPARASGQELPWARLACLAIRVRAQLDQLGAGGGVIVLLLCGTASAVRAQTLTAPVAGPASAPGDAGAEAAPVEADHVADDETPAADSPQASPEPGTSRSIEQAADTTEQSQPDPTAAGPSSVEGAKADRSAQGSRLSERQRPPESAPSARTPGRIEAVDRVMPVRCPQVEVVEPQPNRVTQPLVVGGLGLAGVGLLATVGFAVVTVVERVQAQALLDESPAFGKVQERYVVRDPDATDVALYQGRRATASVMMQLVWIAAGVTAVGAATAGTAWLVGLPVE